MSSDPSKFNLKSSFSKIHQLQNLIKQQRTQAHSLQELKHFLTDTIYKNHTSLLQKMLKLHQFCNNINKDKPFHYIIDTSFPYSHHIEPILRILISSQHSLYSLLSLVNSHYPNAVKEISSLATNLLTNNIFSIEAVSDDYLIIITRLIQDDINNLTSKDDIDSFLKEKTVLNTMLSSLYMRQDIIEYFKEILHFPLTYIDYVERDELFVFDVKKLGRVFQIEKEGTSFSNVNTTVTPVRESWRPSFFKKVAKNVNKHINNTNEGNAKHEIELIIGKINLDKDAQEKIYLQMCLQFPNIDKSNVSILTEESFMDSYAPDITVDTIEQLIQKENDDNMKQYLHNIKSKYETDAHIYSNSIMINQMYNFSSSREIFELYRRFFCIVNQLIEEIFLHLEYTFGKLPDILRYICKIIELSLKKKFPDIHEYEIIPFLGTFLFDKVMKPLFTNPHFFGITDSSYLSPQTSKNIETLNKIITTFYRGELFTNQYDSNFTIFNLFFITKMHIIFHFFRKISTTTKLPSIIDKFLYPQKYNFNPNTFKYDFFETHPNSHLKEICCLYTIKQVKKVYDVFKGNINAILGNDVNEQEREIVMKCLDNIKEHYDYIKNNKKANKQKCIIGIRTFSVITKSKLFVQMERFLEGDVHSAISQNKKDIIISAKKGFCVSLNNIAPLSEYQTESILNCDDYKHISLDDALLTLASNSICKYDIFKWDLEILKPLFKELPIYYTEKSYELFIKEITNEISNSLNDVDKYVSIIGSYNDDITYLKNVLGRTNEIFSYLKKEMILKTVRRFINDAHIRITFGFLNINKKNINNKVFVLKRKRENVKSRTTICNTIQEFIANFPNLNEMVNKESVFEFIKETNVVEGLNAYFAIIKEEIINQYYSLNLNECEQYFTNDPLSPYCDITISSAQIINNANVKDYKLIQLNDSFENDNSSVCRQSTLTAVLNNQNIEDIKDYTINQLHETISNYILGRLYDNIFPLEKTADDKLFETQCEMISKKDIIEFEPLANLNCKDCIAESVDCIHRFEKAGSPLEKAYQLNKIISCIKAKLLHIKGGEIAPDDYLPYVWYSILKAKPKQFKTNINFLELFGVGQYNYAFTTVKTIENRINLNKEESIETTDTTIVSES